MNFVKDRSSKRQVIRIYTIGEAEVPIGNTIVAKLRYAVQINDGNNKLVRTGIFFPDYDQNSIDFDVFYTRSDYIPVRAFLMDHELVVLMMFVECESFAIPKEVVMANVKIRNYDQVAFVDVKKDNIKFKTNEVNINNEDSNTNKSSKPRI